METKLVDGAIAGWPDPTSRSAWNNLWYDLNGAQVGLAVRGRWIQRAGVLHMMRRVRNLRWFHETQDRDRAHLIPAIFAELDCLFSSLVVAHLEDGRPDLSQQTFRTWRCLSPIRGDLRRIAA